MDLEARVAKLERTAKRRGLLAVVFGVLCVGLGAAQVAKKEATFDVVNASQFVIRDLDGKVSGIVGFYDDGSGNLSNTLMLKGTDGSSLAMKSGMDFVLVTKADGSKVRIE
jgi:hypothetical protein